MPITFGPITLRPEYQERAHLATLKYMSKDEYQGPAIIDASVGAGKTILIGAIAKHFTDKGARVMVLARQGELIDQDRNDAWTMGCKVSVFSASLQQKSTHFPCVMGTEQTVANHLEQAFGANQFVPHVLLIDECHHCDVVELNALWDWINSKTNEKPEIKTSYGKIITHLLALNPKMRIIGYTGSPYRGKLDILGGFWTRKLYEISTMELVEMGYLVPPVFGFGDDEHHYDLHEFNLKGGPGCDDYTREELAAMQRKITKDKHMTEVIMEQVQAICQNRLGVLITCAGKKHCDQVAECLPKGAWAIITDDTSTKKRMEALNKAKNGDLKYVIQVGCLTTGVDVSYWSTNVILRRIGSLTLLIQLLGRTARLLKPHLAEKGMVKDDHLILDFTDTLEAMGDIYESPLLDQAMAAKAKQLGQQVQCPACQTQNSQYAVRCIGKSLSSDDGRCEYFFQSRECLKCGADNAPTAQSCRKCDAILIDPNKALIGKAYTDADYKSVKKVVWGKTKSGDGVCIEYHLDSAYHKDGLEFPEVAKEYLKPFCKEPHSRQKWGAFVRCHAPSQRFRQAIAKFRTVDDMLKNKAVFDMPVEITHRVNDKGFSVINRKKFRSGREEN